MQILDISVDDYHSRMELSSTALRHFSLCGPWSYWHHFVARTIAPTESDERRLGTAFHRAMECPDSWRKDVVRGPEHVPLAWMDGATKAELDTYKRLYEAGEIVVPEHIPFSKTYKRHREYLAALDSSARTHQKMLLEPDDYDRIQKMVESVHENPASAQWIGKGKCEVPAISVCRDTGMPIRALADMLVGDTILDYKTTRHATKREFLRDAYKMGYANQGAHYRRVFGTKRHLIITVRNEPPWECLCYEVPKRLLDEADESNVFEMKRLSLCLETGSWHTEGWGVLNELEAT